MKLKYDNCHECADYKNHQEERLKGNADQKFFEICAICEGLKDAHDTEAIEETTQQDPENINIGTEPDNIEDFHDEE